MILIIDDRPEEKIGNFKDLLDKYGIEYKIVTTLESAKQYWQEYGIKKNNIDAIILDYIFPNSNADLTEYTDNIPNGVKFLFDNEFLMHKKMVSLIINTSADKEIVQEYLRKTRYFNHPNDILYTFHDKQPLSETGETLRIHLIEEIMKIMAIRRYNGESKR